MNPTVTDPIELFSDTWWEQTSLGIVSWIQQYGVIITITLTLVCLFGRIIARMLKHTPAQKMFLNLAAGMGFITLVFIFLPYLYLYYLSNSAGDQLVSGDWKGFLFGTIGVLQKASIIITIIVVIMCLTYRQLHGIRGNTRMKQTFLVRAIGIVVFCIVFQFLPGTVQNLMK